LIHAAESRFANATPEAVEAVMQSYGKFTQDFMATGRAGDCAALEPTHTATSVRVREGKRAVQDGPFAETREQLGGYYVINAESEQEALDWAAKIPDAAGGTIEIRPVPVMPAGTTKGAGKPADPTHKEYVLLIYSSRAVLDAMSEAERNAMFGRYMALNAELRASGQMIAGEPLEEATRAKSVRLDGAKRIVRDGPFAETREQLGGYYRVRAKDLDDAISIAARIPGAELGTVEVRPVMDTGAYA
jgi:hypothetical protein